ncbi:MAG: hypothetical protein JNL60_17080, partial [Bacteroidia bacterium]|nr:hypothetical protein [Bacteroidia bacterium]
MAYERYVPYSIILHYITCEETEDWVGKDHVYLKYYIDGVEIQVNVGGMNDGDTRALNIVNKFEHSFRITVWDEDDADPDDLLGDFTLNGSSGSSTLHFNRDEASYYVRYSVTYNGPPPPKNDALNLANGIVNNNIWPSIGLAKLKDDLTFRLNNPLTTDQKTTPLCGPAAICFNLANDSSGLTLATFVKKLYENGEATVNGKLFKPRPSLLLSTVPPSMNYADWIVMASIRDVYNQYFPVYNGMPDITGITTPPEMTAWAKVFFNRQAPFQLSLLNAGFNKILEAGRAYTNSGVAYLLIDAQLINKNAASSFYPNHLVSYLSPIKINWGNWYEWNGGHIVFNCQSWGTKIEKSLSESEFN